MRVEDIKFGTPWDFCNPWDFSLGHDEGQIEHGKFQKHQPKRGVQVENDQGLKMLLKSDKEEVASDI